MIILLSRDDAIMLFDSRDEEVILITTSLKCVKMFTVRAHFSHSLSMIALIGFYLMGQRFRYASLPPPARFHSWIGLIFSRSYATYSAIT